MKTLFVCQAFAIAAGIVSLQAQEPCQVVPPTASLSIPYVKGSPDFNADPESAAWKTAARSAIVKDCSRVLEYPELRTEIRAFWTDSDVYILFSCPYKVLNLFLPAQGGGPRNKLWDRDVVEMFLGSDWKNIRHYREFEIAPTGDWIDLAIDLDHESYDQSWRSGWKTAARIDEKSKIWYAAARIPLEGRDERGGDGGKPLAGESVPHRRPWCGPSAALPLLAAHVRPASRSQSRAREFRYPDLFQVRCSNSFFWFLSLPPPLPRTIPSRPDTNVSRFVAQAVMAPMEWEASGRLELGKATVSACSPIRPCGT